MNTTKFISGIICVLFGYIFFDINNKNYIYLIFTNILLYIFLALDIYSLRTTKFNYSISSLFGVIIFGYITSIRYTIVEGYELFNISQIYNFIFTLLMLFVFGGNKNIKIGR
jgi:hypothetical protein